MRLHDDDIKLFFRLHPSYLFYTNTILEVVSGVHSIEQFMQLSFHKKNDIRNAARKNPDILRVFVHENPYHFSPMELAIVSSWQYAVDGSFYVMRHDAEHALFLDTQTSPRVYGVTSLNNDLEEILGPVLPVYVKTVLLPFKNQIIYDGFLFTYPVTFDDMVVQELHADLDNWLTRHGVVRSLPYIGERPSETDEEKLRYYLRSHWNRHVYAEEIAELVRQNRGLVRLYYELAGKLDARDARRFLRSVGIQDVWCAVLEGRILTTAKNRESVMETLKGVLPRDRKLYPFVFHFKNG